jgi:hypothetical protein
MKKLVLLSLLGLISCGIFVSPGSPAKWHVRCSDAVTEWVCDKEECERQAARLEALKEGRTCTVKERER